MSLRYGIIFLIVECHVWLVYRYEDYSLARRPKSESTTKNQLKKTGEIIRLQFQSA